MKTHQLLSTAQKTLAPFETSNIVSFIQNLTFESALKNPFLMIFFAVLLFYAVIKRSKTVLLLIFASISLMFLVRYTLRSGEGDISLSSTVPFAFGALAIGAVIIYFTFIKGD